MDITVDNVATVFNKAVEEYGFDMEAYADVAQRIVIENKDNAMVIGILMLSLHNAYQNNLYGEDK